MDTIDVSNLNRQFLFRSKDVGRSKAEVAAEIIGSRIPGCDVVAHNCRIEDKDEEFYASFKVIVCGLDSIDARRWLNGMICGLLQYDADGELDYGSIIPIVDGGTEGFKGNARVILPGVSPCMECTLSLYPPRLNFPLCTIAHTPRSPEHCVEWVRVLLWPKESPFSGAPIDGDNPEHIDWIMDRAKKRADEYKIRGVDYRLTQGVVKHIIPAVSSTNAVIAALCAQEVFKLATCSSLLLDNYVNFQALDSIYNSAVHLDKREDCLICSPQLKTLVLPGTTRLEEFINHLKANDDFQLKPPISVYAGSRPLYMPTIPNLEQQTRPNLKKMMKELLNGQDCGNMVVTDSTRPSAVEILLTLTSSMDQTEPIDADNP